VIWVALAGFFVVVFGVIAGAAYVILQRQGATVPATGGAVPAESVDLAGDGASLLREDRISSIGLLEDILQRFYFATDFRKLLAQADLDWSVGRLFLMMLLCGALAMVGLLRISWISPLIAIGLSLGAFTIPYFRVRTMRQKRLEQFEQSFPDALESLARALKAGHPLATGMEVVATEAPPPISTEIRRTLDEWKLGRTWDQALDNLADRIPLVNMRIFVAAVRLQNRTGGRLTEVLAKLSETIREANSLEGEIRAISAHGRMTGMILTLLPIGIALMMLWVNPTYFNVLLSHPYGKTMIFSAIGALVAAHFVIRKILDIKL
jgi:tight adherence protein B